MALDRQSIEKRDFPVARRGYDPDAVQAHLAMLARVAEAQPRPASAPVRAESLASTASEQVRVIVEAAERGAEEIGRGAEREAVRLQQSAREAATRMLTHADALESEFATMLESVREGAARLRQELEALETSAGEAPPAAAAAPPEREHEAPAAVLEEPFEEEPAAVAGSAPRPDGAGDEEGARLIALNMALNGTPRDETQRYLADNFGLTETERLLDDVYARAEQ